jgi:hypothetical protein
MHDDGQNGDAVAGDGIYTLRVPFNEAAIGQIQIQVSAAFRGVLRRVISSPINIAVTSDGTKPLPTGVEAAFKFGLYINSKSLANGNDGSISKLGSTVAELDALPESSTLALADAKSVTFYWHANQERQIG